MSFCLSNAQCNRRIEPFVPAYLHDSLGSGCHFVGLVLRVLKHTVSRVGCGSRCLGGIALNHGSIFTDIVGLTLSYGDFSLSHYLSSTAFLDCDLGGLYLSAQVNVAALVLGVFTVRVGESQRIVEPVSI